MELLNPLQLVDQLVVLLVIGVALVLVVKYWDRLLMAFTGDDRIHGTALDCVWFTFFRCCGACSGDWTRPLTRCCCCCPKRIRGANIVKELGKCLGITTYAVELKNIVVGDLPWDRRANFYICVECAANPPMVTSLAEEKQPKVVHFPEILTLRLRWSPLEEKVRITVKELNVFGSTELCSAHISAMTVLDWSSRPNECMKRIEMKSHDLSMQRETPPWILMELGQPTDERDLTHFHNSIDTVRTATKDGHYEDFSVKMFKHEYTLLDNTGHAVQEPLEDDLVGIARLLACVRNVHAFLLFWGTLAFVLFFGVDFYSKACYKRNYTLTMARLQNGTKFPIGNWKLHHLVETCRIAVEGTGVKPGVPCRPSTAQVLQTCLPRDRGGLFPEGQPQVQAFEGWIERYLHIQHVGLRCHQDACWWKTALEPYEYFVPFGFVAFLIFTFLCRMCGNQLVRLKKQELQRQRALETKQLMAQQQNRSVGFFSS